MSLMSMTTNIEIFPLFATPIFTISNFITEEERKGIYDSIKKITHVPHESIDGSGTSSHELGVDFLDTKIKERIQSSLDEYSNGYGCTYTNLDLIWSNIQNSGSILREHTHPNSLLSGALYINANDHLFFHNPNPYVYYTPEDKFTDFNSEYTRIPVKNCQLLIFPSWLKHGKNDIKNEMDDRVVVSFNATSK